MAGNNDPGKHHLRLGESRIRLHTTAWNAVLAMAARAIYAVTPPSPPPTGTQAAARAPGQASPAPGTIPLTAPEPARPPAAIQLRALAGLTVPPLVPLSPVQPAHQLAPEAENALVRQRMAAAVLGGAGAAGTGGRSTGLPGPGGEVLVEGVLGLQVAADGVPGRGGRGALAARGSPAG